MTYQQPIQALPINFQIKPTVGSLALNQFQQLHYSERLIEEQSKLVKDIGCIKFIEQRINEFAN